MRCTDPEAKATNEVLDGEVGHRWIVTEWTYDYLLPNNSGYYGGGTTGGVGYSLSTTSTSYVAKKKATKLMCAYCRMEKICG